MQFQTPLLEGRLVRRYKRFLADVILQDGRTVTAHTPNTGAMLGCCTPGSRVWLRDSGSITRKYPLGWEMVETPGGTLVGINTGLSNTLVREAVESSRIPQLTGYAGIRAEVGYGREGSRIDFLLSGPGREDCYVEVKNVTLAEGRVARFPDAVSQRGSRHLRELARMAGRGCRAVIFFCVQRGDVDAVAPADDIDPAYGIALRAAMRAGVEALAWRARVKPTGIRLSHPLPVTCPRVPGAGTGRGRGRRKPG